MNELLAWLATVVTIAVLVAYEAVLTVAQRRRPEQMARSAHAALREEWFTAVSQQTGTEILAVQTLRNSLMSATMTVRADPNLTHPADPILTRGWSLTV